MWFHRPVRADEWILYATESPSAHGGRGLGIGRMFTADGVLAATVGQEGMIRIKESVVSGADPGPRRRLRRCADRADPDAFEAWLEADDIAPEAFGELLEEWRADAGQPDAPAGDRRAVTPDEFAAYLVGRLRRTDGAPVAGERACTTGSSPGCTSTRTPS